jgi:hypothetical protein
MFVVDKVCKTLFVALFVYYVGGYLFNLLFGASVMEEAIAFDVK